jgi:predicted DNA-binding mobile mystery protein A
MAASQAGSRQIPAHAFSGHNLFSFDNIQAITCISVYNLRVWPAMLSSSKNLARRRLDASLTDLQPVGRYAPPRAGWIRAIRDALGMSGVQFAARLAVARQSVDDLEKSETKESITLASLQRAADALDCDLVYALVPRTSLQQAVNDRARMIARRALARVDQTMVLEDQQVTDATVDERIDDYIREHVRDRDIWNG